MNKKSFYPSVLFLTLLLFFCFLSPSNGAPVRRVAVLGMDTSNAGQFSYLGPAVREIIKSRIVRPGRISLSEGKKYSVIDSNDLKALEKLDVDYAITGKIFSQGNDMGLSLYLLKPGSSVPIALTSASSIRPGEVFAHVEEFIQKADKQIIKGAEKAEVEFPSLTPTLLAPTEAGTGRSRMHPDLLLRSPETLAAASKRASSPEFVLPSPGPEEAGISRPTLEAPVTEQKEKQGLFAKIFRRKPHAPSPSTSMSQEPTTTSGPVFYAPEPPEERPVLLPPSQERGDQGPSFWSRLWPWGKEEKKAFQRGLYAGGLPYPSPEELEPLPTPGEKRYEYWKQEMLKEEKNKGWLSWFRWPWSENEEEKESAESRPVLLTPEPQPPAALPENVPAQIQEKQEKEIKSAEAPPPILLTPEPKQEVKKESNESLESPASQPQPSVASSKDVSVQKQEMQKEEKNKGRLSWFRWPWSKKEQGDKKVSNESLASPAPEPQPPAAQPENVPAQIQERQEKEIKSVEAPPPVLLTPEPKQEDKKVSNESLESPASQPQPPTVQTENVTVQKQEMQKEEKNKGRLSWFRWPWSKKGQEDKKGSNESSAPRSQQAPAGPSERGPIWQWY